MRKFLSLAVMALVSAHVMAAEPAQSDTLVVSTTPVMHCQKCENKIKSNVRFVRGTRRIETSVPNQTVTIIFDGRKATYQDYEEAFRKIGYEIRKSEPAAK